jgi:resolvase-like protein
VRAGFQALMRDALNRRFDVVLAESLDRLSRDQEDTAGLFKRLTFAGVNIVTLAEGDITHLHIGFKGTMNYGYRVVKTINGGIVTTGEREIVPEEVACRRTDLPRVRRWRVAEAGRQEPQSRTRCRN